MLSTITGMSLSSEIRSTLYLLTFCVNVVLWCILHYYISYFREHPCSFPFYLFIFELMAYAIPILYINFALLCSLTSFLSMNQ